MLPGAFLYAYIGSLLGEVASSVDVTGAGMARHALSAIGLAATIAATIVVTRVACRRSQTRWLVGTSSPPVLTRPLHGHPQATAHICPADRKEPIPAGRHELVVIGGGAAGLVSAVAGGRSTGASLGARVSFVERRLLRWRR